MQIAKFNELLKIKHPTAEAYIPTPNKVNIVRRPRGKVYTYSGTILAVAELLGLMPEIDIQAESSHIVANLPCIGHVVCADTVRSIVGKSIDCQPANNDEFGRKQVMFSIIENDPWI